MLERQTAIPFLVGTKYDSYAEFSREEQDEISRQVCLAFSRPRPFADPPRLQARRFAKAMRAPLIFTSTSASVHLVAVFKIVLAKAFDLRCTIPEITGAGEPLLIYLDT